MAHYRLYLCNRRAQFQDVREGSYGSDALAIDAAVGLKHAGSVQVFQSTRHVITVRGR